MRTIAVLFADKNGNYANLPGVDVWDESRDARNYPGTYPVVAHPPCSRWCRLAGLVEKRWGHKKGDDGGCFISALESVRKWGGVLEHPAYSAAWHTYGLPEPIRTGGWLRTFCGGLVAHICQGKYGHAAKKATWLYAYGVNPPSLRWGDVADGKSTALVSWCGNKTKAFDKRPRLSSKAASSTPIEFRDILISIARSVK